MTQVHSSGGAQAPFATPVSKGKAKAASQPEKKIAVPKAAQERSSAAGSGAGKHGTQVTIGEEALHALAATGEFVGKAVLTGVEDLGEAAYYSVKAIGTGVVDVAKGLGNAVAAGVKGVGEGLSETATAVGHGVLHVENAMADVWGVATQGASVATNLATTLGADAELAVTDLGTAATDVGAGAKAVLSGIGSVASSAAGYGTYIVKQGGKVLHELS
ncbi:MAG: hypothetical protein ACJ8GJ_20570 [Vitreoscilla sp.]